MQPNLPTKMTKNGTRIDQRGQFSPRGVAMLESKILHDTPFYMALGANGVIANGNKIPLFNVQDRIGESRRFLCNFIEAGKIPMGSDIEIYAISVYTNFRDTDPGEEPDPILAEEVYDLLMNAAFLRLVASGNLIKEEIPFRQIPQFNSVMGTGGATGAAKYSHGRGFLKLPEPIALKGGEPFEGSIQFFEADNGAGYLPSTRWNNAVFVMKTLAVQLHANVVRVPTVG